jgi:hypothetical protein
MANFLKARKSVIERSPIMGNAEEKIRRLVWQELGLYELYEYSEGQTVRCDRAYIPI